MADRRISWSRKTFSLHAGSGTTKLISEYGKQKITIQQIQGSQARALWDMVLDAFREVDRLIDETSLYHFVQCVFLLV